MFSQFKIKINITVANRNKTFVQFHQVQMHLRLNGNKTYMSKIKTEALYIILGILVIFIGMLMHFTVSEILKYTI
jgi:hypothetical protein